MARTYRGVVKDNVIVLSDGVDLEEGTSVEVRVVPSGPDKNERLTPDSPLARRLIESGLMRGVKPPLREAPAADRTLVKVEGEPLSEQIIRDRR